MKILLITNFYAPEKTGIGVTATDCAQFLADLGHQVTVITSMPYYPDWEVSEGFRGKLTADEEQNGICIKRGWIYVPKEPSTLKRILHEISVSATLMLRSLFRKTDLVICIAPPLPLGFSAGIFAWLRRKPYWSYIKDIQPDAAIDLGMLTNPVVRSFSFFMERWMYRLSDKVLVLSSGMMRNIAAKGVPDDKLVVVPDSIEVEDLQRGVSKENSQFRKKHGFESKFLVLYSGNLGIKHNVEIIPEVAKQLENETDIIFAIVGHGAAKPLVEQKIAEYQLNNIVLLPLVERSELGDMLASADVLLAPQRREVKDIVVPSKLLAYLTSRSPVVASANADSESAVLLNSNDAGKVVAPEEPAKLAEAILALKENPDEAAALGDRGYQLVFSMFDHSVVKDKYYRPLFSTTP